MSTIKIPIRTVYDGSDNPLGLAEFQVGEVIGVAQGGTSANTISDARINLSVDDANIRSLFSTSGDLSYDSSTGVFSFTNDPGDIESVTAGNGLTGGGTTGDVTLDVVGGYGITVNADSIEITNAQITALVTKSLVDELNVDADTLDGLDSSAFALDTDLTTANVAELTNLYFTNTRAIAALAGEAVSIGEATITGNLIVLGNVVEFNTETLVVEDKNIVLANGSPSAEAANGAGITVDGSSANIIYLSSVDKWSFNKPIEVNGEPVITFNDVFAIDAGESVTIAYTDGSTSESVFSAEQGQASISIIDSSTPGAKLQLNLSEVVINNGQGSNPIDLEVSGNITANISLVSVGDIIGSANVFIDGEITANGSITSPFFYSESDITLKEDIKPIDNPLEKVLNLLGVSFNWKSSKQKSIGVIAQNVEKVLPEIVSNSTQGTKTVSYDSLIPLLIEAIKDQQKQIDELKSKVK